MTRPYRTRKIVSYIILAIALVWTLFPLYWMLSTSFKEHVEVFNNPPTFWPRVITFENYVNLTKGYTPIPLFFLNSVITSLWTVALALVCAVFAGYVISRIRFPLRRAVSIGILVTQMFPLVVLLIPLYILYRNLGLLDTYTGLVLAYTSFTLPFSIWMMKGFVDTIPSELEEAAMVDGCSRFIAMNRIILPLIVPALISTAVFAFLDAWNNLLFPLTLISEIKMKTLPPGMILAFGGEFKHDWGGMMAASTLVSLPVIALFVAIQRYLVEGLVKGAVKG